MNVSQYTFEGECLDEDTIAIIRHPRSKVEEMLDALILKNTTSSEVMSAATRFTSEELAAIFRDDD